jgi:hypothetical protein
MVSNLNVDGGQDNMLHYFFSEQKEQEESAFGVQEISRNCRC